MPQTSIAQTIAAQLGRTAFAMLGASNLTESGPSLRFRIRGSKRINLVCITLTPADLYRVEFFRARGLDCQPVSSFDDVYFDSLHDTIEAETGLYTRL